MKQHTLRLARIAIAAALYTAMSLAIMPLSYGLIQIRFSEMLILLCFYDRDYCPAMVLGCAITNAFSPLGIIDVLFGTLGTLVTVVLIRLTRRIYLAWIPPVLASVFVALEFYLTASEPFWMSFLTIAIGEFIAVGLIGVPVFMALSKSRRFLELIGADSRYYTIMQSIESKRELRRKKRNQNISNSEKDDTEILSNEENITIE